MAPTLHLMHAKVLQGFFNVLLFFKPLDHCCSMTAKTLGCHAVFVITERMNSCREVGLRREDSVPFRGALAFRSLERYYS